MRRFLGGATMTMLMALAGTAGAEIVQFQEGELLTGSATTYTDTQDLWFSGNAYPSGSVNSGARGYTRGNITTGSGAQHTPLMKFDNIIGSATGQVPTVGPGITGITINSAILTLSQVNTEANTNPQINAFRLLFDWSDTDVTAFAANGSIWPDAFSVAGIDEFFPTSIGNSGGIVPAGPNTFDIDLTQHYQDIVDGLYPDYGFLLTQDSLGGDGPLNLSNNNPLTAGPRPLLTIDFEIIPPLAPEPGSIILWCVVGVGALTTAWYMRRRRRRTEEPA